MSNICVKADNLSKHFFVLKRKKTTLQALMAKIKGESLVEEFWVLHNISFEIKKGDKIALIGKNGVGKTTLLRILTGIYDKTSGYLEVKDNPRPLFRFWIGLNRDLSIIDNIYLYGTIHGMSRDFLRQKIDKILEMAELYKFQFSPLKNLSMGQTQRLALSIFFENTSNFLIFDESLEFVDEGFAKKSEGYFDNLSLSGRTVIMTSRDTSFLKRFCSKALWLDEGRIRMFDKTDKVIDKYRKFLNI